MPTILQNHYVLAVPDVRRSADFYVNFLGFKIVSELPGWIFVAKDSCMVMLGECPEDMPTSQLGCQSYFAYLRVEETDAYRAQLLTKDRQTLGEIADRP